MAPVQLLAHADTAAEFLTAFANSKRIQIMCEILGRELPVGVIASKVGLSQSALSQHLARLRNLGLVHTRRDKQTIYYSCGSDDVRRLFKALDDIFADEDESAVSEQR
ncbi:MULTISPECIES: ArsR/SmtB family transcription factor [Nitratireductor]|uniref:ArsR/SmtB family transcription factor n=1 Tax=Nitratireductor TaxID=245876 RepID=UPI000D0CC4DF|nr:MULTISPECIES: metalloregulator ArsR/SmtB family transcription factor [Nitratireductor]PSM17323.1 ArsR family transcriptional regulator [Nitratireductor sp. StC3]